MRSVGGVLISLATSEPCAALPDTPSNSQSTACPETSTISTRVLKNRFFFKKSNPVGFIEFLQDFSKWMATAKRQTNMADKTCWDFGDRWKAVL